MFEFFRQILRQRLLISGLVLCILPFSLWGALAAFRGLGNNVYDWLPSNFESKRELDKFVEIFSSAELLMISWDECTLSDTRIHPFKEKLLEAGADGRVFFSDAITGQEIRDYFEVDPGRMSPAESRRRMQGWIVSKRSDQTGILAIVSEAGAADRHAALAYVYEAARQVDGLSPNDMHVAGPTIEGVAVDQASRTNLLALNIASYAICLTLMFICLRNIRAAYIILLVALFNQQLSLAIIHYLGAQLDSVLLLTANLTFVLSISIGVHFTNYYRDALGHESPSDAPARACVAAFVPTSLATITTALGLISLSSSEIIPLSRFGVFSAISLLLATITTLVFLALHFAIWPLRIRVQASGNSSGLSQAGLGRLIDCVRYLRVPIILLALFGLGLGYLGTRKLRTAVGLKQLVTADTRIVRDYNWIETELGPLIPVEVVLSLPTAENGQQLLEQFRNIGKLHRALEEVDQEYTAISAATFAPAVPERLTGIRQITAAAKFRRELFQNQEQLSNLGYIRSMGAETFWRLTLRVPAMRDVDYGELLVKLRQTLAQAAPDMNPQSLMITGGVPLIYQVQQQLLQDLLVSFVLAFGLICLALMLVFRSIACGLICMLPNIFPCAVVFGCLGWLGVRIEVGTILTASAALGIAVDDTLHFITWFRQRITEGGSQVEAVAFAYRRCGLAMVQTTLVITLGLLIFAYSSFAPMQRFAWCMFALLVIALLADLVILPALLISSLGRPFQPKQFRRPQSLSAYAWQTAGPRDALINFAVNAPLAAMVYGNADRISLTAFPSLLTYCGPMSFLLPAITSFFGFMSGISLRRQHLQSSGQLTIMAWKRAALTWSIAMGLLSLVCCWLILKGVGTAWPEISLSRWETVIVVGSLAAFMGYVFHALAVVRAGRPTSFGERLSVSTHSLDRAD